MCALEVQLQSNEELLSRTEHVVLTNRRIVAALNRKDRTQITDDVPLSDIPTFKKSNGGQESRLRPGLLITGAGVAVTIFLLLLSAFVDFGEVRAVLDLKNKMDEGTITQSDIRTDAYLTSTVESDLFQRSKGYLRFLTVMETVLFLLGAVGILVGLYFIIGSVMRIKPFTVVVFNVVGARDIPAHFPGNDSPDADNMTRLFVRAKRGII